MVKVVFTGRLLPVGSDIEVPPSRGVSRAVSILTALSRIQTTANVVANSSKGCETWVMSGQGSRRSELGQQLRELRESRGWSLREVATRAGVNHGYLSQLERGEVAQPAPSMLHKAAAGYEVPFVVLMRWAGYVESDDTELTTNQALALSYLGDDVSEGELAAVKAVL